MGWPRPDLRPNAVHMHCCLLKGAGARFSGHMSGTGVSMATQRHRSGGGRGCPQGF